MPTDPGKATAHVYWTPPVAADNGQTVRLNATAEPGDPFPLGHTRVAYVAEDSQGLQAECSFDVKITGKIWS